MKSLNDIFLERGAFTPGTPQFKEDQSCEVMKKNISAFIKASSSSKSYQGNTMLSNFPSKDSGFSPLIESLREPEQNDHMIKERAFEFIGSGDKKKYIQISGTATYFGDKSNAITLMIKDLTSYKELEIANTMSKYKSILLSSTSHELRNPLTGIMLSLILIGIIGMLECIEQNVMPEGKFFVKVAKNSSEHMLGLINDILVFHKFTKYTGLFSN